MTRRIVNAPMVALTFAAGTIVAAGAATAVSAGPPRNDLLELLVLGAVAAVPGSIMIAMPALVLGLGLLPFKPARHTGIVLVAYSTVYGLGLACGGVLSLLGGLPLTR